MVRAGIIGAGYIAASHADAYHAHPGVELAFIADPVVAKADALAARYGATGLADVAELLACDVDLVSVCTPTPTHADIVVASLAAGKNVLCEKPIARTLEDSSRIVQAARVGPGLLMIGHVSRFEPDHWAARDVVADGQIGTIAMMSQSITGSFPGWSQDGWLADPAQSGGPLVDLAIHSFDFLTWVCGARPLRVHAVGSVGSGGLIDYALATVRYDTGAMALVETSWAHPENQGLSVATELVGIDGRLGWDYQGISLGGMHTASGRTKSFNPLGSRGFHREIAAFVDAVSGGQPSPVPAEDGLLALRMALAADESIRTGAAVELPITGSVQS